jgi:putative flippase GtrA
MDVAVLETCLKVAGLPIPVSSAIGVLVGSAFTFFANRHFAFRDHKPELAPQAAKFIVATSGAMMIHSSFVWALAVRAGVPVVLAKFIADILVFSVGQLLLLRYVVFPKERIEPQPAGHSQAERYPPSP